MAEPSSPGAWPDGPRRCDLLELVGKQAGQMRIDIPADLTVLQAYLPRFLALVGEEAWFRRADHLEREAQASPFRWKIVADYHWLEMAISHQSDVLTKRGSLDPELVDGRARAALLFAAGVVECHDYLASSGRRTLLGRLRDGLNAETGYAALYLEIDLALRLMADGLDVAFPDMEGAGQFDLAFSRGGFTGEVECKSVSEDAGRQIHRKDFYRLMELLRPALDAQAGRLGAEVLVVTLPGRLSPNTLSQRDLARALSSMLREGGPSRLLHAGAELVRQPYSECLGDVSMDDSGAYYAACTEVFGANCHVAGQLGEGRGCLVVLRSQRVDDPSKPVLEALRKAATQFSGQRPGFIAIQFHGIEPADLMLPNLRWRMGVLTYALYGHYGAAHVAATYFTGFGAVVARDGDIGTPAFAIPNPRPRFPVSASDARPFQDHVPDVDYAAAIGAPLPAENISYLPL